MTRRPYWIAAAVALWGLVVLAKAMDLAQFDQHAGIGPGFLPSAVGAGLLLLAALLALQIARGVRFEEQEAEDVVVDAAGAHVVSHRALALAAAACLLPVLAMKPLGFVLTCTGCFVLVAAAFRSQRHGLNLLIGLGFSLVCWAAFRKLGVQLGGLFPIAGV